MSKSTVNSPLISIIIPCYNDWKYIEDTINSALNQSYENKEIIVVDDGSDIKTKEALKNLSQKVDKIIVQENRGLAAARNSGIKASNGSLILPWDADDLFQKDFLKRALDIITSNSLIKIVSCKAERFDETGKIDNYTPRGGSLNNFLFANSAFATSLFYRKEWDRVGGYDENLTGYEDWEFFIRLLKDGGEAFIIDEVMFYYRQRLNSLRIQSNSKSNDLWMYIFLKHKDLYMNHYDGLIKFYTEKLKLNDKNSKRELSRTNYKFLRVIFKTIRKIKYVFKQR